MGLVDRALAPLELTAGYGGAEGGTCEREEGRRGGEESATHRREEAPEESEEQSIKDWREEGGRSWLLCLYIHDRGDSKSLIYKGKILSRRMGSETRLLVEGSTSLEYSPYSVVSLSAAID